MSEAFAPLLHLTTDLATGKTTSRALVEQALAAIAAPDGEGRRTFVQTHAEAARKQAEAYDAQRKAGRSAPPLAGIPMSVKDLFDEAGCITTAGSRVLEDAPRATQDALAICNLKQAGLISVGRTTMTEFAFSGVGVNPHTGTPANPWDRTNMRIPGGSSSGAAISVTDGMAAIGIGSDTGGSCRIPAALTGIVGYKPTASRISTDGTVPLSFTLDSVGSLGRTVSCCWAADRALSGQTVRAEDAPAPTALSAPRFGVLQTYVLDGMDDTVAADYQNSLQILEKSGAILQDVTFQALTTLPEMNRLGGFPAPESLTWHEKLIATKADLYDPFVLKRILRGKEQNAVDYINLIRNRKSLIIKAHGFFDDFDAILMPTVPIIAPRMADLTEDETYTRTNLLLLRNPTVANFLDGCAISLPCHTQGTAPVGLMAMCMRHQDDKLFALAAWMERALKHSAL